MSSKPSEDCVRRLREVLRDRKFLMEKIVKLREAAAKLPQAEEDLHEINQSVVKLMEGMDLKNDGNTGWASRMIFFLQELDRQAES